MPAAKPSAMNLRTLLAGIAETDDVPERVVQALTLDSRDVAPGSLFLACAGTRQHGSAYIDEALNAGASAVVWESEPGAAPLPTHWRSARNGHRVPIVGVPRLSQKLGLVADRFYDSPSRDLFVVGITGTNGKTSCSHFLAQALHNGTPCGVIGTLGYGLFGTLSPATHTTPDAITCHRLLADMRDQGAKAVAMEVSSHGLDQGRVNAIVFDVAVFTNLSRDHLDYHGHMGAYARAKRRLFEMPGLKAAVINRDDEFGRELISALREDVNVVSYGLGASGSPADVVGEIVRCDAQGLSLRVTTPWGEGCFTSGLLGQFNASNLLAVLATLLVRGLSLDDALSRVSALTTVPGRMERFGGGAQPLVVVDYAHTPDALDKALQAARQHCTGQLWCVFGCGGDRDPGKRPLMGQVATALADRVIVTDDNPRTEDPGVIVDDILAGMRDAHHVRVEHERANAIEEAICSAQAGDVVLVAGKGHEAYQQVGNERRPFSDAAVVARSLECSV